MSGKKLTLSASDKKFAGVCGGMASYFGIDSTLIRVVWVLLTIFSAVLPMLLAYVLCALIIPKR